MTSFYTKMVLLAFHLPDVVPAGLKWSLVLPAFK